MEALEVQQKEEVWAECKKLPEIKALLVLEEAVDLDNHQVVGLVRRNHQGDLEHLQEEWANHQVVRSVHLHLVVDLVNRQVGVLALQAEVALAHHQAVVVVLANHLQAEDLAPHLEVASANHQAVAEVLANHRQAEDLARHLEVASANHQAEAEVLANHRQAEDLARHLEVASANHQADLEVDLASLHRDLEVDLALQVEEVLVNLQAEAEEVLAHLPLLAASAHHQEVG